MKRTGVTFASHPTEFVSHVVDLAAPPPPSTTTAMPPTPRLLGAGTGGGHPTCCQSRTVRGPARAANVTVLGPSCLATEGIWH